MILRFILSLFMFVIMVPSGFAKAKTKEYVLSNGLKVIVREDHRAPVVVSLICYRVGSAYEKGGLTGVSHALEHMMFKGTGKYPPGMFSKIIARNGGQENAYTSRDYTCYFQKMAANRLGLSFQLEADRMFNLSLDEDEFKKEIEVVKEERRMRTEDKPQSLTYERFNAAAHIVSPYHHPIIGWMDDLNHMTVKDLRFWYHSYYAPNNAILIVVGDVRPKDVYHLAKQSFNKLPKAYVPSIKPQRRLVPRGERRVEVNAPATVPWLVMGYNTPSIKTALKPWVPYALEVLAAILDGGESARLPKELIRKEQIASNIGVSYDLFSRFDGLFVFTGTPSPGHSVSQLQQAILKTIENLRDHRVSEEELARVKTQVIAESTYMQDSQFYQAMLIGRLESAGISWRTLDEYVKNIQAVTVEQVKNVARRYLNSDNLTIATLKPMPLSNTSRSQTKPHGDHHAQR